ncbi:uncharacterized protein LOC110252569 [Exaiptasia diaphana]|uniref:Glucosylceramidase n=1 Tax=Exaiptasia diaphana TaxID=2652724 RepID=A0A913Y6C5_EXADI|nr:uncharacterized protein LOC110252569 [Exaiptasia diaphana]KXJ22379.1 Non-lysosomal glucosylceramidase [Exaiptasia diaphana]
MYRTRREVFSDNTCFKMSDKLDIHVHICMYSPDQQHTVEKSILLRENKDISWSDVVKLFEKQVSHKENAWFFQYFDDEQDMIFGKTELEWKEAINTGCELQGNRNTLHISAFPMKSNNKERSSISGCCSKICGDFCRPIPEPPPLYDTIPNKVTNMNQSEYKYSNEALRAVALPLGGLGGGNIALAGDGGLRQWQICNEVNHLGIAPDSFFAIRVDQGSTSKAVALQSDTWYNQEGFVPAAYITDHVVPEASKQLLSDIPGIKTLEITAKYPIAEVDYLSDEVPVQIHLEAFSPTIPLDSKNSALPVVIFNFTVTNTGKEEAKVSLLGSLQNIAGWDGTSDITSEVHNAGYGGNINSLIQNSDMYGIDMYNPTLPEKINSNGHVGITVMPKDGDKLSCELQYSSVKEMWEHFTKDALVGQGQTGPSPPGTTWNGALWCTRTLQPNTSEIFTFFLAWHFPHRYVDWNQPGLEYSNPNSAFFIGNQYSNFWKDIKEVLTYTAVNLDNLTSFTRSFRDSMFEATLPWQLIDSAAGRISVLKSPTCMWNADGNFYAFEGCSEKKGCCPLNCTHVWNYEMALAKCYPDLEQTMRNVDLNEQITPHDVIPSRTIVPLVLRRIWTYWDNYSIDQSSTTICVDGEIGTVLKMYREVRQGAPHEWFNKLWPKVKKIMSRWMTQLDNGQGVITGPQPNTYDCAIYGINVYIGGYYLAALRAAEEMAKLQGEMDLAAIYHERFLSGRDQLDTRCFNGKWYTQIVDPKNQVNEVADGTWVDCLVGQWWAHSLGLGYILKKENIQSTLQNVFVRNHVDSFNPATQKPRQFFDQRDAGLTICVFPDKVPEKPLVYYSEGAWSGLEYEFAALCLYEGLNDIAIHVLTDTRNKYDGTRRSPWNEIECGDHYARPMSSFLLFETASGQDWNFDKGDPSFVNLRFAPRINECDFRGFFILGCCWGQYVQKGDVGLINGRIQLTVSFGELRLSELSFVSCASKITASCTDGENIENFSVQTLKKNGQVIVRMPKNSTGPIIKSGSSLILELSG